MSTSGQLKDSKDKVGYNGALNVKFTGIKGTKGRVCFKLFNGPKGFPDGDKGSNLKEARCIPIAKGMAEVTLINLPYGTYAIAAVHDTVGDARLRTNALGIPTDGVAISNNPNMQFRSPSFFESQFLLSSSKTELQIQFKYW